MQFLGSILIILGCVTALVGALTNEESHKKLIPNFEIRRCPNCGRTIPIDARKCPYCTKNFR